MEKRKEWELICAEDDALRRTSRLDVPGGWLYRIIVGGHVEAMRFVPKPFGEIAPRQVHTAAGGLYDPDGDW